MDVSIVVTVLNEEGAVDELYHRVAESLNGRDWEAIFVDDGSTDGTPAKRRALQAQLRPASRDARRPDARARRSHRDEGRRPAERARGHSEAARDTRSR